MISIVIPFCNEVPQVLFTAQSLYNQLEGREFEILLVDNRSNSITTENCGKGIISDKNYFLENDSAETFDCYSKDWTIKVKQRSFFDSKKIFLDDKIKYLVYDEKLSHWNAKNFGVAHSKYPYLLFLDAHCELSTGAVIKLLRFLKHTKNKKVGAVHCLINYMLDSRSLEYGLVPEKFCYRFKTAQQKNEPYKVPIMSTCGMMMKKKVFDDIGGWSNELGIYGGGEAYIGFKLATCGYEHWIVPDAKCWHYAQDRGYSWNLWDWMRNNLIAAYTVGGEGWLLKLKELFSKEHPADILEQIASDVKLSCAKERTVLSKKQVCSYDDIVDQWNPDKIEISTVEKKEDEKKPDNNKRISIIIPAQNEELYLNRTIQNIYDTCTIPPEVIVIDNGGNGKIDKRAVVLPMENNVGERAAMNKAVEAAHCDYILRIDAHCDFTPKGWDMMMSEVTGEKDITVAVLGALRIPWGEAPEKEKEAWLAQGRKREQWKGWERLKGHWYGLCRIIISEHDPGIKGLECKWQKPNRDHTKYKPVEPNMGLTGCGFMLRKSFYKEIGGADESLPKMGAIGEEFALKAWANGGKVQTRTDVMIGHIFGTGGYDTSGVKIAQQKLWMKYQDIYPDICKKFSSFEGVTLIRADQPGRVGKPGKEERTVTAERTDTHDTKDGDKLIRRKIEKFRYVWLESEHPDEKDLTQKQIEEKYAPLGVKIDEKILYADEKGELIKTR